MQCPTFMDDSGFRLPAAAAGPVMVPRTPMDQPVAAGKI
jgi:hypothetical protein